MKDSWGDNVIPVIAKNMARFLKNRRAWRFVSFEYCPVCDTRSMIIYSSELERWLADLTIDWKAGEDFRRMLAMRENYLCATCMANYRMRMLARTVLDLCGYASSGELSRAMCSDPTVSIYETAAYNIFRLDTLKKCPQYVVSEYLAPDRFGEIIGGIRNESLERLTFPDNSFDVVINSDVLEHVADIGRSLEEVRRVLKPGGHHVFTVPVDYSLECTMERARVGEGGIEHLLEPIMHGDTIRDAGVLVFRDFGRDTASYVSREKFPCLEKQFSAREGVVASVFIGQKAA